MTDFQQATFDCQGVIDIHSIINHYEWIFTMKYPIKATSKK